MSEGGTKGEGKVEREKGAIQKRDQFTSDCEHDKFAEEYWNSPIVRSCTGWNLLSVNCSRRHDLPTPAEQKSHDSTEHNQKDNSTKVFCY